MTPTEPMEAKGIRLPKPLWERIEGAAASLNMTRSDFLRRKLGRLFDCDVDVVKRHVQVKQSDIDEQGVFDG